MCTALCFGGIDVCYVDGRTIMDELKNVRDVYQKM